MTRQEGELLFTLYQEREWRLGGYAPFSSKLTLADVTKIEADIRKEFPEWTTKEAYPRLTDVALERLRELEAIRRLG